MALKAWPWPGLPSFPRLHFPGKPGKKAGKPGQATLFQAYQAFDRVPDARVVQPKLELEQEATQTLQITDRNTKVKKKKIVASVT